VERGTWAHLFRASVWGPLTGGGRAPGRHASPDTPNPARAEIAATLGSVTEPEMWKCCSRRVVLRGCGRFCHAETRVARNEIPALEGIGGLSRGDLAQGTPESRNGGLENIKLGAPPKPALGAASGASVLHERIRALDDDHALRLQLLGGDVDIHLIQPGQLADLGVVSGPSVPLWRRARKSFSARFFSIVTGSP
jgi:hypothetical protein